MHKKPKQDIEKFKSYSKFDRQSFVLSACKCSVLVAGIRPFIPDQQYGPGHQTKRFTFAIRSPQHHDTEAQRRLNLEVQVHETLTKD